MLHKQILFKKEYGLIAITAILLIVSYQLAFKKTIAAWQLHSELKNQLTGAVNNNYQPDYLERKNSNLHKIISLYKVDTTSFRSNVLSTISSVASRENVKLSDVPIQEAHTQAANYSMQKLSFEGNYFALIKTLHDLQGTSGIGIIRAVKVYLTGRSGGTEENRKLMMEIYFEISVD